MTDPAGHPPPGPRPAPEGGALPEAYARFVATWGQMGSSWGIPRTMAEVHALLYITGRPLNTDEIMERLGISRGSASMSLRSLVEWGIVYREHIRGDRKEYFTAEQDVWKLFRTVLRERKKREIDPLLEALYACRELPAAERNDREAGAESVRLHHERLDRMIEFMRLVDSISQRFISPTGQGLEKAARLLARAS